jgi:hypothetical protein
MIISFFTTINRMRNSKINYRLDNKHFYFFDPFNTIKICYQAVIWMRSLL